MDTADLVLYTALYDITAGEKQGALGCTGTGHGLILVGVLLSTTDPTSPSGGDQTDLLSGGGTTLDSGSLSNMLMVTTTMGMLHRIHGNTTHLWPAVPLHSVLVEGSAGLEDRLVDPSTSSNTSNHGTVGRGDNLLGARG